jgi:hypothetical protein
VFSPGGVGFGDSVSTANHEQCATVLIAALAINWHIISA